MFSLLGIFFSFKYFCKGYLLRSLRWWFNNYIRTYNETVINSKLQFDKAISRILAKPVRKKNDS